MNVYDVLLYAAAAITALVIGSRALHAGWRGIAVYRIWHAGPRHIRATTHRLWRGVSSHDEDLVDGPGGHDGAPVPPYQFLEEHVSGTQPCVSIRDGRERRWRVKWGNEVRSETFAVRFAWSCGYFAEVTYFIPSGTIHGTANLQRTHECIRSDGTFIDARFELDDPGVRKMFEEHSWSWDDNPFLGTRELTGLKIVVMLLSNWDTKDRRDVARGSNTAIFEHTVGGHREARYLLSDWGGSMGRWGTNVVTRGRWDVQGFEDQTAHFVSGGRGGRVSFGYTGQHTADMAGDVPIEHARWFHSHVRRLTVDHLEQMLRVSGATEDEARRFAEALMERIRQLGKAVEAPN